MLSNIFSVWFTELLNQVWGLEGWG